MGIMVYSLLWVMQDLYHNTTHNHDPCPTNCMFASTLGGCESVTGIYTACLACMLECRWSQNLGLVLVAPRNFLCSFRPPYNRV